MLPVSFSNHLIPIFWLQEWFRVPTDGNHSDETNVQSNPLPLNAFKTGSDGDAGGRLEVLRVQSSGSLPSVSVLLIRSATTSDAGLYRCAMRGDARRQLLFILRIRGACLPSEYILDWILTLKSCVDLRPEEVYSLLVFRVSLFDNVGVDIWGTIKLFYAYSLHGTRRIKTEAAACGARTLHYAPAECQPVRGALRPDRQLAGSARLLDVASHADTCITSDHKPPATRYRSASGQRGRCRQGCGRDGRVRAVGGHSWPAPQRGRTLHPEGSLRVGSFTSMLLKVQ